MNIQRRTFLGGLLAAIATAKLAPAFAPQQLEAAEERIKLVMPEPEEGYQLTIQPGYGLKEIKVTMVDAVPADKPAGPEFSIHMERPSFFSNQWNGSIKPVEWYPWKHSTMKATVSDEDSFIVREWMAKMIEGMNHWHPNVDYKGKASFGQAGKDPIIMIDGLFPQSYDMNVGKDITADVVFLFDYAQQNVL